MPQVVAGAAISAAVSTGIKYATGEIIASAIASAFAKSFVVSAVLGGAMQALAPKPPAGGATGISVGNTKDPIGSRKIIYGEIRTGGTYVLFGTSDHVKITGFTVDNTNGYTITLEEGPVYYPTTTTNMYLHSYVKDDVTYYFWDNTDRSSANNGGDKLIVTYSRANKNDIMNILIAVAGHEVEDISDVYYDDQKIGWFNASGQFVFDAMDDYADDGKKDPMFFRALGGTDQYIEQLGDNIPYRWSVIDGINGDVINSDGTSSVNLSDGAGSARNRVDLPAGRCCDFTPDIGAKDTDKTSVEPPNPFFSWDEDYQCNGTALLYARLRFWSKKYNSGLPKITCVVKGKKVYDPREDTSEGGTHDIDDDTTWEWSDNAALCILNYLMDERFGMGILEDEIDMDTFVTAANTCDNYEFTLNGAIDTASTPRQIVEQMLTSCGGKLMYTNGQFRIYAQPDLGTLNGTFDESNFIGGYTLSTRSSGRESFNGVKGIYAEPNELWQPTEYRPQIAQGYVTVDGRESITTLDMPFTTDRSIAEYLAQEAVLRSRQQLLLSAQLDLSAIDVTAGDTIRINNERLGFTNKEFEVIKSELGITADGQLYVAVDGIAYVDTAVDADFTVYSESVVSTITTSTSSVKYEAPKPVAWCVFDGTDYDGSGVCTINAEFNVASVVRSSAGRYTVTFVSELVDAYYSVTATTGNDTAAGSKDMTAFLDDNTTAPTATAFVLATDDTGGTPQDPSRVSITVFR